MSERKNSLLYGSCIRKCGRDTCKEDGICPVCWAWESAMSKGKEFPPRRYIRKDAVDYEETSAVKTRNGAQPEWWEERHVRLLSLAEHEHLVSEARREGRAEAYRHAAEKTANADNQYWEQYFREASEGANE